MTANLGGIDPHQASFTAAVIDHYGAEVARHVFDNTASGYLEAIDWFGTHDANLVGIEGSAKWGAHVAIALTAADFDVREVSPERAAIQRRSRRLDKTDAIDAIGTARALQAEPDLGPAQTLEIYDPLVAKIEAVLEQRRALVATRTLMLQHLGDQIAKLTAPIRDQIDFSKSIESRLRQLEHLNTDLTGLSAAGAHRLSWLRDYIDHDRQHASDIYQLERELDALLDEHGTSLRNEDGISTIGAATLICEVGDPFRFTTESKFARWCGTSPIACSSAEGRDIPHKHRLDTGGNRRINSVIHIMSITQKRINAQAQTYLTRQHSAGKTPRCARRSHKRLLAARLIRIIWKDEQRRKTQHQPLAA